MEEIQRAVEKELRKCSAAQLIEIGKGIEVDEQLLTVDRTKPQVMRAITDIFDGIEDDQQKRAILIKLLPSAPANISTEIMRILAGNPVTERNDVDDTLKLLKGLGIDSHASSKFRREFKVTGTICESSKDSLNYISLCSQINDGKKKGYSEDELAIAVRLAVSPGSNLRTYLDAKSDISLEAILSFIRTALHEKSSSELYQDMNSEFQKNDEDPQKFILRTMELREKIKQASLAEGSIRFDAQGVRDLFLHTVRTGLRDDSIKSQIEPLVRRGASTSDEELIHEVNLVVSEEAERHKKRGDKKKVNVAAASVQEQSLVLEMLKDLKEEVKTLREEVNILKKNSNKRPSCEYCLREGKADDCRHCYRCGSGDHKGFQCKKPLKD